jgi:hypothetical protein
MSRERKTHEELQREEAEGGLITMDMLVGWKACELDRRKEDLATHLGVKRVLKRYGLTLPAWAEVKMARRPNCLSATVEDLGYAAMWLDEDRAARALAAVLEARARRAMQGTGETRIPYWDAALIDMLRDIGRPNCWGSSYASYDFNAEDMRDWLSVAVCMWNDPGLLPERHGIRTSVAHVRPYNQEVLAEVRAVFLHGWMDNTKHARLQWEETAEKKEEAG